MRRAIAAGFCLLLLAACGRSQAQSIEPEDLDDFARNTSLTSREFSFTRESGENRLQIDGYIQDDYRYEAQVLFNGQLVYEEKVIDDTRFLRVENPPLLEPLRTFRLLEQFTPTTLPQVGTLSGLDLQTEDLLATKQWAADPTGAPAEFQSEDAATGTLDALEVWKRVRFLESLPSIIGDEGGRVTEWNPDNANYLPSKDKFPPNDTGRFSDRFVEKFLEDGVRFDVAPDAFDPTATPTGLQDIERFFLYTSVWAKDGWITRVGRAFELPDPEDPAYEDFYEPLRSGTIGEPAKEFLSLLKQTRNRRLYTEFYTFRPPAGDREVVGPEGAVLAVLKPPTPVEGRPSEGPGQVEATATVEAPAP